jgi:hypothetical protein
LGIIVGACALTLMPWMIRNAAVAADVNDLRDGEEAIEERARHDLGMIKTGETFVQIYDEVERKPVQPIMDVSANPATSKSSRTSKSPKSRSKKPAGKSPASSETRNKPR